MPVLLSGKSYGQRNPVGYCSYGCKESDMTEQLSRHPCFYLKFIPRILVFLPGEMNCKLIQCYGPTWTLQLWSVYLKFRKQQPFKTLLSHMLNCGKSEIILNIAPCHCLASAFLCNTSLYLFTLPPVLTQDSFSSSHCLWGNPHQHPPHRPLQ